MIVSTRGLGTVDPAIALMTVGGSFVETGFADFVNKIRNGWTVAPAPGAGLPSYSAPPAPNNDQLLSWTPTDAADAALKQFEADKIAQSQAIADAEANGSYNPNFLPNLSSDLKTYMIWAGLITGAVVIAGLAIGVKR